ncbi:APC family permease [Chloroflexi bacterium CFX3]|nr:APC family permease [Chloroflexi bacterium CFX3]
MAAVQERRPNVWRMLVGKPLATKDLPHQAVSRAVGLAVFASDALSSTAYATEEILVILAFAGSMYFGISIPIAFAIATLLFLVTVSYRQTILAYPNGGGAYIVARDNLGEIPAQIAAAALLIDYVLTVAVSISSGVAQIASAAPDLRPLRVEMALAVIIVMTIINLRGVKESGRLFAIPTYFFIFMSFTMLIVGLIEVLAGRLNPVTGVEIIHHDVLEPLTLFIVLRAFSSGCAALTGIEAISNGITAFKEPRSRNAAATLMVMSTILVTIFVGFTLLANAVQAIPSHGETVVSQMARAIYGRENIMYYATLAGTALILLLAANTGFADFPRLAALVAADGFLPRQLTIRGSRLVFSVGIITLGTLAGLLVVFLQANVSLLIPLYAVGVFLSFTLSQSGMVVRFWKAGKLKPGESVTNEVTTLEHFPHWRASMITSAVGAVATFIVMMIFAITKFTSGAWFIVLLIPAMVLVFSRIHHHYQDVAQRLSAAGLRLKRGEKHVVSALVLVDDIHIGSLRMIDYAKSLGVKWRAIHVAVNPAKTEKVRQKWLDRVGEGEFTILESPYRQLIEPIRDEVQRELDANPEGYVNIILGHLAMDTVWEQVLHQNNAYIFSLALQSLDRVVVTTVPYQCHHDDEPNGNGNGHTNGNGYDKKNGDALPPEVEATS